MSNRFEDPLPAVFRILLSALGFQEPSWIALFVVLVSVAALAIGAVAVWEAVGGRSDRGDPESP